MTARRHAPRAARFHPVVEAWFRDAFPGPTPAQRRAWPEILAGRSTLVCAPTGSGKTLAAFLAALERLMFAPVPEKTQRCRVLYVSPLKALAVDVERNLREPLAGIAREAERSSETVYLPSVAIRTGDTPAADRARMARRPPDILITTPESLFLILTSKAQAMLASVEVAIIDEIHALVGNKRGAHLALSLERLAELAPRRVQRIGLSATQRPLETVARFLGGFEGAARRRARAVRIVDVGAKKPFELKVEVPVEDMSRLGETTAHQGPPEDAASVPPRRSIWPAIHPRLLTLIRAHRSTILFVNSRRLSERLAAALNELAGEELVRAHHGSLAREERLAIEDALKAGRLPGLVATSTLELGIDMGAVDLVVQIETPPSVASGMQRIGRASHQAGAVSRGVIFPKYRGDLLATAAMTEAMTHGAVEETRIPMNPLDVLAQHLVSAAVSGERSVDETYALVLRAAPFSELPRRQFEGVLDMLSGRYPSDELAELRPRLVWDRLRGTFRAREGARALAVANAGTIPDRGLYGVFLTEPGLAEEGGRRPLGRRVGELDEEMVFESQSGDVFVLGASSWRIDQITRDRVLVTPAPGEPGRLPFWKADRPPRPVDLGRAIGRLTRELAAAPRAAAERRLAERHALDAAAARNLLDYLEEQRQATGALPDDRTLVLERTRDELGDWRLCLLSPWGGRVHAPLTLAIEAHLRARGEGEVETLWSDDGIVIRLPERDRPPELGELLPGPEELEALVTAQLGSTALFAARFRESAARALLLPRRRPGQRTALWMQRKRAADLLAVAARFSSFPIVLEAYRECLKDVFDLPALVELARGIRSRAIRPITVDTSAPSPFSASLLFGYVANYIYDGDAPLAERRAQALAVDQRQLRELLGEAELRELLDADALAELELELQCLDPARRAASADRLHDLLRQLGDLGLEELAARVSVEAEGDPEAGRRLARRWLEELSDARRVIEVQLGGEPRFAAAEDAGRLRDAFGVAPPRGIPDAFLEPVPHALREVVARHARTHGPFSAHEVARRYGMGAGPVETVLGELAAVGRVLEGEFRPRGSGREWCDARVLATLRRRSLARLRRQVEPAEPTALGRLLPDWQCVVQAPDGPPAGHGPDALLDVIEPLQGAVFPASALEADILPARLPDYRPGDLDALCAAGELVWVGVAPLGEHDGRIALYLSDHLELLHPPAEPSLDGALHRRIREHLSRAGASFFAELHAAAGGGLMRPVLEALWDLVWAGEVTNDTLGPLRSFLFGRRSQRRASRRLAALRSRRAAPASAGGRWSLVARLRQPTPPSPTERLTALAGQLLARHGVLTRAAVASEAVPGGFAALYPVLSALEEQGRVRRGYFLAGLGGSQFAEPGALDRLRAIREAAPGSDVSGVVLAASDPAQPYGAALAWPASSTRLARTAGAHAVLVDGQLAAYLSGEARDVVPFLPEDEPARSRVGRGTARALTIWARRTARPRLGWGATGTPLMQGPLAPFLAEAGFEASGSGARLSSASGAAPATIST